MHALLSLLLLAAPHVVFSTYAGGRGSEWATGIAFDPKGDVVVCGDTTSRDFTWLPNAKARSSDAVVAKLAANGAGVRWAKRFSSIGGAFASALAIDAAGNIYVTGRAWSDFPITADAAEKEGAGGYLAKLSADGDVLYATYLGREMGIPGAIAIDARGNATIAGSNGQYLAVVRVSAAARRIDATELGGKPLGPIQLAVDDDGNVYVGALVERLDAEEHSRFEGILTKFDAAGRVVFSKRLGGSGIRWLHAICVTRHAVWVAGDAGPAGAEWVVKLDRDAGRVLARLSPPSAAMAMTALRDGGVAICGGIDSGKIPLRFALQRGTDAGTPPSYGFVMVLGSDASIVSSSYFAALDGPRAIASDGSHRLALFGVAGIRHLFVSVIDLQ